MEKIPENIDARLERAGKKGHRYVKRSFKQRKERIRREWLRLAGELIERFDSYLREKMGC